MSQDQIMQNLQNRITVLERRFDNNNVVPAVNDGSNDLALNVEPPNVKQENTPKEEEISVVYVANTTDVSLQIQEKINSIKQLIEKRNIRQSFEREMAPSLIQGEILRTLLQTKFLKPAIQSRQARAAPYQKPKKSNLEFWSAIIFDCMKDVTEKLADMGSPDLDRGTPLIMERSLLGYFTCSKCYKDWDSTKVMVKFEYNVLIEEGKLLGEIGLRQFGQRCNQCEKRFEAPVYDLESALRVANKLKDKILEKYYGQEPPKKDFKEPNETPREKRENHDIRNCEACIYGVCKTYEERLSQQGGNAAKKSRRPPTHLFNSERPQAIKWSLFINGESRKCDLW